MKKLLGIAAALLVFFQAGGIISAQYTGDGNVSVSKPFRNAMAAKIPANGIMAAQHTANGIMAAQYTANGAMAAETPAKPPASDATAANAPATGDFAAQPPAIDARAYILVESETGEVLCGKNTNARLYPASMTKIMTAVIALENGDPDQVMVASQAAVDDIGPDGSNIGIIPGEKIRLQNLLQAMLICSANEAANIIAENIGGSREEFIGLMNRKAGELGATGTHFANASGIHDPMHYTTASDMAVFARYAMKFPMFREIVRTPVLAMPPTNKHPEWPPLPNTNKLLASAKDGAYSINGIKTGFTGQAGFNLAASAVDSNGMELISVVMGVTNENAQENVRVYSKELLEYGFNNFKKVTLIEKGRIYKNVPVENAADAYGLDLVASETLSSVLPASDRARGGSVGEILHLGRISAPVNEGDIMGYVEFQKDGKPIGKVSLAAARSVEYEPGPEKLHELIKKILSRPIFRAALYMAVFILFFFLLRSALRRISRNIRARRY